MSCVGVPAPPSGARARASALSAPVVLCAVAPRSLDRPARALGRRRPPCVRTGPAGVEREGGERARERRRGRKGEKLSSLNAMRLFQRVVGRVRMFACVCARADSDECVCVGVWRRDTERGSARLSKAPPLRRFPPPPLDDALKRGPSPPSPDLLHPPCFPSHRQCTSPSFLLSHPQNHPSETPKKRHSCHIVPLLLFPLHPPPPSL